jgi:hypothetical protein
MQKEYGQPMLIATYIETLLVDKELADQVWDAWDQGETDELTASVAWFLVVCCRAYPPA